MGTGSSEHVSAEGSSRESRGCPGWKETPVIPPPLPPASSSRHRRGARELMTQPNHLPRDPGSLADPGQPTQLLAKLISKSLPFVFSRNLPGFSFQLPTPVPNSTKAGGSLRPGGDGSQSPLLALQEHPLNRKPWPNTPPSSALPARTGGAAESLTDEQKEPRLTSVLKQTPAAPPLAKRQQKVHDSKTSAQTR